jgi:hypothetical protein
LPGLCLLGALLFTPRIARANSGHHFYETIGISIAVGTVLGASTLPFYSQPGTQFMNVVYGASLGAVVGIGVWLYEFFATTSQISASSSVDPRDQRPQLRMFAQTGNTTFVRDSESRTIPLVPLGTPHPILFWMPLVSLTW